MGYRGEICYNSSNHIANAPALLQTAGGVRHRSIGPMANPIVVPPADSNNLKRCSKCGQLKPRGEFSKQRKMKDGLRSQCKACVREYRTANAEHIAEYNREYRTAHADRLAAYARAVYAANAERERERQRDYYAANAERVRERFRKYIRTPQGKAVHRAAHHRRRARKEGNGGSFTASDLAAIRAAQTDKKGRLICWACNKPIKGTPHLDHWVPLDKAGANDAGNLHYMHAKCNLTKNVKHPFELGRLL